MSLAEQMQQDKGIAVSEEGLRKLADLADRQLSLEAEIDSLESELKKKAGELKTVAEGDIPSLMTELGVSEFKLTNGAKVTVKPFYSASVPKEPAKKQEAFTWLRKNDHEDLIKNEVSVNFGKGEDKRAEQTIAALKDMGLEPEHSETVHPMTLKAFVREQVERGAQLPMDLFNVFIGRKAKIEKGK